MLEVGLRDVDVWGDFSRASAGIFSFVQKSLSKIKILNGSFRSQTS